MGKGHLSFDRAQTQYLDGVALRFIMASNGGFTVVAVVRFSGSPGHWERIIDFGHGAGNNNIILARSGTSSDLVFDVDQGDSYTRSVRYSVIVQARSHRWQRACRPVLGWSTVISPNDRQHCSRALRVSVVYFQGTAQGAHHQSIL